MITEEEIEKCLDFKRDMATLVAQALHDRTQLDNFKNQSYPCYSLRHLAILKSERKNTGLMPMRSTKN